MAELSQLISSRDDEEQALYTSFRGENTVLASSSDNNKNYSGDTDKKSHHSINNINIDNGVTKNNLGTFFGVYVPTILGTFGVVIFLRLSWITGQAGFINTILMYLISYAVVGLTVLSVCAVATNGEMKAGGTYYLISRSLGPEFGGSLGVIFFVANICGCAFFILGFVEAIVETFHLPHGYWLNFGYATLSLLVVALIVLVGANLFAKTAFIIFVLLMSAIIFAFISYFFQTPGATTGYTGMSRDTLANNAYPHYGEGYSFRILFGILFPSVTGMMTGSNLSGDLASPAKSLPIGTFGAGITTMCVYMGLILTFSSAVDNAVLSTNQYITQSVAFWNWAVVVGIFSAISSSALATLIGASRILQALSRDDIFPLSFFGVGSRKGDEPRRGVVLGWILVQVLLLIPNLNILAPYISMLYLLSFSITNLACFVCDVAGLPNFRPSFKYYHWSTALAGSISSLVVMFIIDPIQSGISLSVMVILWLFIHFRAPSVPWGGISQALIYHQVRKYLLRLEVHNVQVKIWRPGVLLLVSSPRGLGTPNLMDATNSLKKGGLFVVGNILVGEWKEKLRDYGTMQKLWLDLIEAAKWKTFLDLIIAPSVRLGVQSLVLSSGVGGMKPNTIVVGYLDPVHSPNDPAYLSSRVKEQIARFPTKTGPALTIREYVGVLKDINSAGKNIIVARNFEKLDKIRIKKRSGVTDTFALCSKPAWNIMSIDIWVVEDYARNTSATAKRFSVEPSQQVFDPNGNTNEVYSDTSALIVQLGYILHTAAMWCTHTKLRVLSVVMIDEMVPTEITRVKVFLEKCRVKAEVIVLSPMDFDKGDSGVSTFNQILKKNSVNTAVSFFPLPQLPAKKATHEAYVEKMGALSAGLGPIYLVRANEKVLSTEI